MNIMRTFEGRLKNIKLIAFDLDNTLYDETIYFKHSFKIITPYLKNKFNIMLTAQSVYKFFVYKGNSCFFL